MKSKMFLIIFALVFAFNVHRVYATPFAFCGFVANPPVFPFQTMLHSFSWDLTDALIFPLIVMTTTAVPPPGVITGNNPHVQILYTFLGGERSVGIVPLPPTGTYTIYGNDVMSIPPTFIQHPGSPFLCNHTDFIF